MALRPPRSPWASLRQGSTDGARDGEKKIRERDERERVWWKMKERGEVACVVEDEGEGAAALGGGAGRARRAEAERVGGVNS